MRWKPIIIITSVIIVLLFFWWFAQPEPIKVTTINVQTGLVETTLVNTRAGTVTACRRAHLSPAMGGQILQLHVSEGDLVESGQLLMELWNKDAQAHINLAKAEQVTQQARRVEVCTNADVAGREVGRIKPLANRGLVSNEQMDLARAKSKAADAACDAANSGINTAKQRVAQAEVELERSRLYAPFAGIVAEVNGEVGEFVTPSPPGIATPPAVDLIDNSCLYVSAPIDEVDAAQVKIGQPARVTLDAFRGQEFPASIKRIAPYVVDYEKQARTVLIEAVLDASSEEASTQLLPGYSADVEIILEQKTDVLRLPSDLLLADKNVYLLEDGKAVKRKLELGISNWKYTEVLSGLEQGSTVISSLDAEGLADGVDVQVVDNLP